MKDLFDRVNIFSIVSSHKDTLYDYARFVKTGEKKTPFSDKFIFLIAPIILSCLIVFVLKVYINQEYLNIIITALSIFVGLLFALLTLVFDLIKKEKNEILKLPVKESHKFKLLQELFINISFSILLSILTILFSLLTQINPKGIIPLLKKIPYYQILKCLYLDLSNIIAVTLIFIFLMTLLMILKRFFIIFNTEIK